MPPEAKVAVFEDDPEWQEKIRRSLTNHGHSVVVEALTLQEALDALETFREKNVNVVVLGGNLDGPIVGGDDPENDSRKILYEMRITGLDNEVKTVGLSGLELSGTTVDLGKTHVGALGAVVSEL